MSTAQRATAGLVDVVDHNVFAGMSGAVDLDAIVWLGPGNQASMAPLWPRGALPDFRPPEGSAAIDAALDLSRPFTLDGVDYPALPMPAGRAMSGAGFDIGAVER